MREIVIQATKLLTSRQAPLAQIDESPLRFDPSLAIMSALSFAALCIVTTMTCVLWYRDRPVIPAIVLCAATVYGAFESGAVVIISVILLATLIISTVIRRTANRSVSDAVDGSA